MVVTVQVIGEELLAKDAGGRLIVRIATVFPRHHAIVTLPGIHATQRVAFTDGIDRQRRAEGLPPLTEAELEDVWQSAVDLVLEDDTILIRPDPAQMGLAFEADELLQEIVSKKQIQFLHVPDPRVRDALKRRGERWRISPLPRSPAEMKQMIAESRLGIGGKEVYYYNKADGTRWLTYAQFAGLSALGDAELRQHLVEIRDHAARSNGRGLPEVDFFVPGPHAELKAGDPCGNASPLNADASASAAQTSAPLTPSPSASLVEAFAAFDFHSLGPADLRSAYQTLAHRFRDAVPPELRDDDLDSPLWRGRMFAVLIGQTDKTVSEEELLGLTAEFYLQIEWLPGGRIEDGELILDPLFEEEGEGRCPGGRQFCDEKARGFIFNFIRDYGDLEYVNIGRVLDSLTRQRPWTGRRGVYLAEIKERGAARPVLRILRMQKWGVREHLDEGKDLLRSMLESEEYTEYILDRRLGCRQLGMNLPPRTTARRVAERYAGPNRAYLGMIVSAPYFERDYVLGLATDKIPSCRYADERFALGVARVLGRAAAPNLIVGRCDMQGRVIFDDGDELVLLGPDGLPAGMVVADHTGTFVDFRRELRELAVAYAEPIRRRAPALPDPKAFAEAYLTSFVERFGQIQHDYDRRKRAFDSLFRHRVRNEGGSFAYRWERVLARVASADPAQLAGVIRQSLG